MTKKQKEAINFTIRRLQEVEDLLANNYTSEAADYISQIETNLRFTFFDEYDEDSDGDEDDEAGEDDSENEEYLLWRGE